jgi:hypothetical protein
MYFGPKTYSPASTQFTALALSSKPWSTPAELQALPAARQVHRADHSARMPAVDGIQVVFVSDADIPVHIRNTTPAGAPAPASTP